MEVITFNGKDGVVRKALRFGQHKINLHPDDTDWFRAKDPHCGGEDFCVITETPMDDVVAHLERCGVQIEEAPSERSGALGTIYSVYFRDPDGNLVEVSITASGVNSLSEQFDYIVVGSGSAGGIIAARLGENGKHSVLCLEAGEKDGLLLG